MKEIGNVLRILKETKKFIKEDNSHEIKVLSNQTVHSAAISQDADNIIVAVLVYSLSKILEREHYREMDGWKRFYGAMIKDLASAILALEKEDIEETRVYLGKIRNSLNEISGNLGQYVKDIFRKAEINKAFKLYEHGLSSEQTAELLGVSLWDLASYIGQSHIGDSKFAISMPVVERVKIAEEIFG
ncbi:hypothetical protein KAJ38_01400 [Candidatus Pacearchaeota archaeon]|nr:hypothetical protein [Candidatus Pacearchaeota archaeon]